MTLYMIRGDTVTAYASAPARASEDELRVGSAKEIETSGLSNAQMAAILECAARDGTGCQVQGPEDGGAAALGGFRPIADCFGAGRRFGRAAGRLEAGPGHRPAATPGRGTIDEMANAMGWQRHTVRGLISGALKKKLGLDIVSEKTDRGRLYRISESRAAAR
jgi:hypothetical protein